MGLQIFGRDSLSRIGLCVRMFLLFAPLAKPLSPDIVLSGHHPPNSDLRMEKVELPRPCVRSLLLRLRGGQTAAEAQVAEWTLPENTAKAKEDITCSVLSATASINMPVGSSAAGENKKHQSEDLLLRLMGMFAERHGRMPTETEMKRWSETFREASESGGRSGEKEKGKRSAEVKSVIHISGLFVDLEKSRVVSHTPKRDRTRGSRHQGSAFSDGCRHRGADGARCDRRATYWDPADSDWKSQTCRQHAPTGFLPEYKRPPSASAARHRADKKETSSMRCAAPACATVPSYGELDHLTHSPDRLWYCMLHKAPHHINCRTLRCRFQGGCSRQARFGSAEDNVKLFCGRHAPPGHTNLADPKCRYLLCPRRATFGRPNLLHPQHCRRDRKSVV